MLERRRVIYAADDTEVRTRWLLRVCVREKEIMVEMRVLVRMRYAYLVRPKAMNTANNTEVRMRWD